MGSPCRRLQLSPLPGGERRGAGVGLGAQQPSREPLLPPRRPGLHCALLPLLIKGSRVSLAPDLQVQVKNVTPLLPPDRYTHISIRHNEKVLDTQSCMTLRGSMDYNLPGSPVHGISQARILEWVAMPFFRASSQPRDQTQVSCFAGRIFTT